MANVADQAQDPATGAIRHTYIPRSDGAYMIGGVAYYLQASGALGTAPVAATPPVVTITPVAAAVATPAAPIVVPAAYAPVQPPQSHAPFAFYNSPALVQPQYNVPSAYYNPHARSPYQGIPPQVVYQQPQQAYYAQPQQPYVIPQPYGIAPQQIPAFNIQQPAYGTIGYTGYETLGNQMAYAQASNVNDKQEMKPADDDPFRMYWVREEDGTWTQRNRLTIESGDIGDCRWYAMDGKFYAVRLPQ